MTDVSRGSICIWNDIAPEGRAQFYDWHLNEHMPERVGIPGFTLGRRFIACEPGTSPEFFTWYETTSYDVLVGQDYLTRLNNPTPWTKTSTQHFRNTQRALTRVKASRGTGPGGFLGTIRFGAGDDGKLLARIGGELIGAAAGMPQISGAQLCVTDSQASAQRTTETRGRADIQVPPDRVVLIEGCNQAPVRAAVDRFLADVGEGNLPQLVVGIYRLEHVRLK